MVTIRIRSVMWFAAGAAVTVALAMVLTTAVWRADALPGPSESTIVNVTPERVLDSRDPVNLGLDGPFASQVAQKLQLTGSIPTATGVKTVVPTGATGVLLNVTGFNPSANGFISIRPGDATGSPTTSSINILAGETTPNSVQVALPTTGANAGQIDITYDALGQTGPFTDMLIDVVGYTTSTGLADLTGEREIGYGHVFSPNTDTAPTGWKLFSNIFQVNSGQGIIEMNLPGPERFGTTKYGLKSVTYCLEEVVTPGFVETARVYSFGPTSSDVTPTTDPTDRTQAGCYTITVNDTTHTSHTLSIIFGGGGGQVDLANVTAIWAPTTAIPKGPPSTSGGDPLPGEG